MKLTAMKLIILAAFIACSYGAKLDRAYLPPEYARTSGGSGEFLQTPILSSPLNFNDLRNQGNDYNGVVENNDYANEGSRFTNEDPKQMNAFGSYERPERPRAALERNAAILRQDNENDGETYSYAYETENGIAAEENGVATNGVEALGSYSYTGDDGQVYSIRYTAGRNGFVPEGDHLPTPPPIPEEIQLALEQNARDEAAGIYDDGSYSEGKYASGDSGFQTPSFGHSALNSDVNNSDDDAVVVNSALSPEPYRTGSEFANGPNRLDQLSNGVTKAYLPPTAARLPGFSSSNHRSSFNDRTGYNY